jgi:hypothetical protein
MLTASLNNELKNGKKYVISLGVDFAVELIVWRFLE